MVSKEKAGLAERGRYRCVCGVLARLLCSILSFPIETACMMLGCSSLQLRPKLQTLHGKLEQIATATEEPKGT